MYRTLHAIYCDRDQHFDNELLWDFLKSLDIVIDYSLSDAFKSTDMMKMFNRLLEEVLWKVNSKTNFDITWDLRLAAVIKTINERVISYLDISLSTINFEKIQKTFAVNFIILHLSERDIRTWHDELITSTAHCNHVRVYLNHRVEMHDMIQIIITHQRLEEATRYNREIFKMFHHSDDLVMLYQKKIEKLESKWRDSFRIQDYDDSHDLSFILTQLNDRKVRESFHDDHLKMFISRTRYLTREAKILSQNQTIRKTRVRRRWNMILFCRYEAILSHAAVYSFFFFFVGSRRLLFLSLSVDERSFPVCIRGDVMRDD